MLSSIFHRLGLSLSGGGYRVTAFHLGTLKKLQKMDLLNEVDVISTVSGGSIAGAYFCLHRNNYAEFEKSLYEKMPTKNVIGNVLLSWTFLQMILVTLLFFVPAFYFLFTSTAWLFPVVVALYFFVLSRFQFLYFSSQQENLKDL
jgi:NTE family protein